METRLLTICFV